MALATIDVNSDIGEMEIGSQDISIVKLVSSVNISCGVHAGSGTLTIRTIALARAAGCSIGAHPGMPGAYGRGADPIDPEEAYDQIRRQLAFFIATAYEQGAAVKHVKPHGALYNQAESIRATADAIACAVKATDPQLLLYCLAGGRLSEAARKHGLRTVGEFFADRGYNADGTLLPRTNEGAVIDSTNSVRKRVIEAIQSGAVETEDGLPLRIQFESICVHGDNSNAVLHIMEILKTLKTLKVRVGRPS